MPRSRTARSAALAPANCVTIRSLARARGCSVHRVMRAIALGQLRTRRQGDRVLVDATSAAGWQPTSVPATAA